MNRLGPFRSSTALFRWLMRLMTEFGVGFAITLIIWAICYAEFVRGQVDALKTEAVQLRTEAVGLLQAAQTAHEEAARLTWGKEQAILDALTGLQAKIEALPPRVAQERRKMKRR